MNEQNRKTIGQYLIESVKDKKFRDHRGRVYEITELRQCTSLDSSTLTIARIRYEDEKENEYPLSFILGNREVI